MTSQRALWLFGLVVLAVLSYRFWLADDGYQEVRRLEKEIASQSVEVATKRLRNRKLNAEVKDLKEGVDAVEERARTELGMTRKDETFVQIVNNTQESESLDPSSQSTNSTSKEASDPGLNHAIDPALDPSLQKTSSDQVSD